MDAPVDRLLAFVDESSLDELAQRPRDGRLVAIVHRQVEVIPVAEHTQPLELAAHDVDETRGIGTARAPEISQRHLALFRAELAIDLQLDRQPVAVIAEHVGRVVAHHRACLDDEILEDLVHRRADVNLAVRVGRAVVQHELRPAAPGLADPSVEVHLLPAVERLRLGRLKVRLHREIGARQVEGVFPVRHVYPFIVVRDGGFRGRELSAERGVCAAGGPVWAPAVALLRIITGGGPSARSSPGRRPGCR